MVVVEQVMDNEMMGVLGQTAKGTKDAVKKLKDLPTRSWGLLDFRMQKNVICQTSGKCCDNSLSNKMQISEI